MLVLIIGNEKNKHPPK